MAEREEPFGRPRKHDRDQIAKDMIEWAELPTSINLCGFCCTRKPPISPRKISEWAKECDDFREAYETAKAFLGSRREELLNAELLHVKGYDLNAKTYDFFLDDKVREYAALENNGNKETTVNVKVSGNGLGRGVKVSTEGVSTSNNRGPKLGY